MFGKKIRAPTTAKSAKAIKVARAFTFPITNDARRTSVVVPRSAPRINGIAFFKFIRRAIASGTNSPIVIPDEKSIAVRKAPRK